MQDRIGKPMISAAVATVHKLLTELGLRPVVQNAGAPLHGTN